MTIITNKQDYCPLCGASWVGGTILDTFKQQREEENSWCKGWTDEQLMEDIAKYYSPPYRWSRKIGLAFPHVYDGTLFWQCPDCMATWDAFTGREKAVPPEYYKEDGWPPQPF